MRWRVLAAVLLVFVGGGAVLLALFGPALGAGQQTQYLTARATQTDVVQQAVATGSVTAHATYGLAFGQAPQLIVGSSSSSSAAGGGSTTWRARTVNVRVGDAVKKGQVLATADTTDLENQLRAATASVKAAYVQTRIAQLALDGATTDDAIRQAKVQLYSAQAQFAQAQETRTDLVAQLHNAKLVAPGAGIVSAVNVVAGVDAPSGNAIEIEFMPFEVTASFAESDVPTLKAGQAATVTISALGQTLNGKVSDITPVANSSGTSSVVTYAVTVTLDNAPSSVRTGMSADVSVTVASANNVLAVPTIALNGSSGNYSVRVLDADGEVEVRPVEVGLTTNSLAEIRSGLQAGEVVVTGTASSRQGTTGGGFGPGFGGFGGGRGGQTVQRGQGGQTVPGGNAP